MEELRSTESLDREIQEEARRKAEKILKASENDARQIAANVSERIEHIRKAKEQEYAKKIDAYRKDTDSAIPLEKQRLLVSFVDISVHNALSAWFREMGEDRQILLLKSLLAKYKSVLAGRKISAVFHGFTVKNVKKILEAVFGPDSVENVTEIPEKRALELGFSSGIFVESADHGIICRATMEELTYNILMTKRQELAENLLGGEILQSGRLPE
ncbi:hypothetical protein K7I13_03325 [Brucepastera parasyntrophica]|uniref:hypothetical protein n=1 Tax=Brucepastera parasyntrophica TaxID=2880008 RepID=UPI00210D844B|nr:hypothetical protein [Brucepastera parasyntrophica]ULQ60353.1 hypothetical protein K7I13_03325 [Brucepastera parasyntrophica]